MSFKGVFLAVFGGAVLVTVVVILHSHRPAQETDQPTEQMVRASGKCAECHRNETSAVVHQFETSRHAQTGMNCLECHRPVEGQTTFAHRGFEIAETMTAANCAQCHPTQYDQFLKSRHAASAWAAVKGSADFTAEQIAQAEKYHPGSVDRPANQLAQLEGAGAIEAGCGGCHDIGKPNQDGSIGSCTDCHGRHGTSLVLAREPATCGQCHMGPDHAQLEIYSESKHGVLFKAQRSMFDLSADPQKLTTAHMSVPTCATCHMSGLEGMKVTHNVSERLSYWLFAPISEKRPNYANAQDEMKEICTKCHAKSSVNDFYATAEMVVTTTNAKVGEAQKIVKQLRDEGLLTPAPFDEPIEFVYFDYWHYYGRTAKHGAFMGGADFVQWHGNYELLLKLVELKEMAAELRGGHAP